MSFFKGVGEKLFPSSTKEPEVKASAILAHIQGLGLSFNSLSVKVTENETVILEGEVASQADAEKIALAAGNVEGVEAVDNRLQVAVPEPEADYHTVEKGDWLSKIAQKYYGDPNKYNVIFEANKPMLSDPDKIYPGQVLRIPKL